MKFQVHHTILHVGFQEDLLVGGWVPGTLAILLTIS